MGNHHSPENLETRARVHAALGDVHRLAIVEALRFSDRSPSDLAQTLGIRSNLLAHHLLVLERAGVVETVRSAGDGRRRYVRLLGGALEATRTALALGGPATATLRPRSILFVCSANSARSPLAVALWRRASDIPAASAGTRPAARLHPLAVEAGAQHGLDLAGMTPRAIETMSAPAGLVVTVCDEANEALQDIQTPRLHWSIPDPVVAGRPAAFEHAIEALSARIGALSRAVEPEA